MPRLEAIKNKYKSEGLWSAVKEVPVQGWDLVKENPRKTAATFVAIAAVASLTAAYFLSPVYATFVGASVAKAAALVSPAITAMSAFAVAHPLIASLVVLAAVAALITAPVYAYMNSSKASQIDAVKEVFKNCEKDGDKLTMEDSSIKLKNNDAPTLLTEIAIVVGLAQQPAK